MCCKSRGLSRLGVIWGLCALGTLLIALVSGYWLYTKEPVTLPNSDITTAITFRIGLWRICPSIKRINSSIHVPTTTCSYIKYTNWDEVRSSDLGVWAQLDLTPSFITRMRSCTVLSGTAVVSILFGFFFAILGHCSNDNRTLIASGMFILGALFLGTGLVVFASALSESLLEATEYRKEFLTGPAYDYRYGWCFFTAGAAFIMTKMAAVFSLSGYLNRFPSVDEMVRIMVPGGERKLREHQRLSSDYMERHLRQSRQYNPICTDRNRPRTYEAEYGPLLNKTPPDVCTTNRCNDIIGALMPGVIEDNLSKSNLQAALVPDSSSLAGQTVPIIIKNKHLHPYLSYPVNAPPNKYGTLPHSGNTLHQGFLGVSEISSSSNSSSSYYSKSKTLQHQRPKKKCVKIETFQTPDTGFTDFGNKMSNSLSYSGSAV